MAVLNPRVQRDEFKAFMGKKVMVGTRSYHYISGWCQELTADNQLRMRVGDEIVHVPLVDIATIQEAPESQAEYVK